MSDSDGVVQDGAQTVDANRFNGLMAAYQKEKARADALEKRFEGTGPDSDDQGAQDQWGDTAGDSQQTSEPGYEDGELYEFADGEFLPWSPPQANVHNEARPLGRRVPTDDELSASLDRIVGKPTRTREWPDPTIGS